MPVPAADVDSPGAPWPPHAPEGNERGCSATKLAEQGCVGPEVQGSLADYGPIVFVSLANLVGRARYGSRVRRSGSLEAGTPR